MSSEEKFLGLNIRWRDKLQKMKNYAELDIVVDMGHYPVI